MQLKPDTLLQNGKYKILRTLGQGGFGITYEAEHMVLHKTVAIKEFFMKDICNRDMDTSTVTVPSVGSQALVSKFKDKFIKEARTIWGLHHPHIVRVTDVFEENGTAYYVMENMKGGSLKSKVVADGPLSESNAEHYIRQVADALAYIHSENTVHLDVKPTNILLNDKGEAVLIDFGLSKHYDNAGDQTSSTPVGLSKGFAPLEQNRDGDVSQFRPSTDIYALGATMYFLVTGKVPPEASIVNEDGLSRPQGVSERIWGAIQQAMQPRQKDRPQDIAAFLALLNNQKETPIIKDIVDDEKTEVPVQKTPSTTPRKKWLKPLLACLAALAAVIAVVLGVKKCGQPVDNPLVPVVRVHDIGGGVYAYKVDGEEKPLNSDEVEQLLIDLLAKEDNPTITILADPDCPYSAVEPLKLLAERNHFSLSTDSTIPEEQSASESEALGSIKVVSDPSGATIWLDGKNTRKKTPYTLNDIAKGQHAVRLILDGYEEGNRTTQVLPSSVSTISLSLTPRTPGKEPNIELPDTDDQGEAEFHTSNDLIDNFLVLYWPTEFKSISAGQATTIKRYVNWLKANPDVKILVCGYSTKREGAPAINLKLAEECGAAVNAFIQEQGIAKSRIVLDYKGGVDYLFPGKEYRNAVMCTVLTDEGHEEPAASGQIATEMRQVNVFFNKESIVISSNEAAKLNSYADWLKANPSVNIAIAGHAAKGTGNASHHQHLAEERAATVKAYLLKRGIAESRIVSVVANGDRIQPFEEDELNEVVICTSY